MSELLIENKAIVAPGEELARGMDYIPGKGAYRLRDSVYANELGIVQIDGRAIKLIPLSGKYIPKADDVIICKVIDVTMNGWRVETNSAYNGMISLRDGSSDFVPRGADLTRYFNIDDYVVAKIINVTSQKLVDLTAVGPGLRRLRGGQIFEVGCKKVPRIIGKQGSMVSMIKGETGCQITVGQNGLVWINGDPMAQVLAIETIKKIEEEAHMSGLTETIKDYLTKRKSELGIKTPAYEPEARDRAPETRERAPEFKEDAQ